MPRRRALILALAFSSLVHAQSTVVVASPPTPAAPTPATNPDVATPSRPLIVEMANPPQGAERITDLIQDLQYVHGRQHMIPGSVQFIEDPTVQALIHEGDSAVEPLLQCLVHDERTLPPGNLEFVDFPRTYYVYEVAFAALSHILNTTNFGIDARQSLKTPQGRAALADAMRAYWQRTRGQSPEETAFNILADDHADARQWLHATLLILLPQDVIASPDSQFSETGELNGSFQGTGIDAIQTAPLRGEVLRARTNPSVTDLFLRRMHSLEDSDGFPLLNGCAFAMALAQWDGKAHLDELRAFSAKVKERWKTSTYAQQITDSIIALDEKRIELGDPSAAADYAGWLAHPPQRFQDFGWNPVAVFKPIWRHPTDPILAQAAQQLLATPGSPWIPFIRYRSSIDLSRIFDTPLYGVPAFRQELLRGLGDTTPIGTITLQPDGNLAGDGTNRGPEEYTLDPLAPPVGSSVNFRLCDAYANSISWIDGAPRCELYWSEKKRDEAVTACVDFLLKYGDNFTYDPNIVSDAPFGLDGAHIHFPTLDHPASPDDVDSSRAIFSLPGSPRLVTSVKLPVAASWITNKDYPALNRPNRYLENASIYYLNQGTVWQAEEVQVNGQWKRYYGFTGRFHIDKVPAAEIQFQTYEKPIFDHFEATLSQLKSSAAGVTFEPVFPRFKIGDPLPLTYTLRNLSGLDQPLPNVLTPIPGANRLPPGITPVLLHSDALLQRETLYRSPNSVKWSTVPLRTTMLPATGSAPSTTPLSPNEQRVIASFDLRDLYDLSLPGTYRFYTTTDPSALPPDLGGCDIFTVIPSEN